jgi:hypothetical protein
MNEKENFEKLCRQPHRKMRKCFMTAKTCVYDELVERQLRNIQEGKCPVEGFMVIPFRPNLNTFYDWSLTRFFKSRYGAETEVLKRADQVRRTGYVICEKICRRIQEAAFVVVDISVDNANVLYEFGISYGLRQKLLVIHDTNSLSAEALKKKYLPEDMLPKVYAYPSIKPIAPEESFINRFYSIPEGITGEDRDLKQGPNIVILDLRTKSTDDNNIAADSNFTDDISLSFAEVVKGAIGVSISNIVEELNNPNTSDQLPAEYLKIIDKMKTAVEIGPSDDARFNAIRSGIDRAFCVLIRTSLTHPFSYFWLGYCHSVGKNVIPIYEVEKAEDKIDDLAFDIRSLWHLVLVKKDPSRILPELQEILKQMILTDFGEWSRKAFWSRIFGRSGRLAIFTGALHNPDFKREMVGDWDLRTASELMSYFSTHQELAIIESPIYQPEKVGMNSAKYIDQIGNLLKGRNAVVIASPDVNPLTELLLGRLYGVSDSKLFTEQFDPDAHPIAAAAVKKRKKTEATEPAELGKSGNVNRFFFIEEQSDEGIDERGFRGNWLPGKELLLPYLGQTECKDNNFKLYAHLVIALNPFTNEDTGEEAENFVVILNGISGPSTFALTQLLTGGMGGEFVDYGSASPLQGASPSFNPHGESEKILSKLFDRLNKNVYKQSGFCGVQCVVKVEVGPPAVESPALAFFDSRRVKTWQILEDSLKLIEVPGKKK